MVVSFLLSLLASQSADADYRKQIDACLSNASPHVALDCASRVSEARNPPPVRDASTPATRLVGDCRSDARSCRGSWRGIRYLGSLDRLWLELPSRDSTPNKWIVRCAVDKMTDGRSCLFEPESDYAQLSVVYLAPQDRRVYVDVRAGAYPGSLAAIRVGELRQMQVAEGKFFNAEVSREILKQMRGGHLVRTRYFSWPYNRPIESEVDTSGFQDALELADAFVRLQY